MLCSVAKDSVQYVTAVSEGVTQALPSSQAVNALMNGKGGGRGTRVGKAEYKRFPVRAMLGTGNGVFEKGSIEA